MREHLSVDCMPDSRIKAQLLFISGPVGVGKTTFSRKLLYLLSSKSYKTCYGSLVSFSLLSYVLYKLIAVLFYGRRIVEMHEKINVHPSTLFILRTTKTPRFIKTILMLIEALSVTLYICIKICFRCINKEIIIIDEGIINMIASYFEVFSWNTYLISYMIVLVEKLQRHFNLRIIYLDVQDDVELLRRWEVRGYPKPTFLIGLNHHLRYTRLIRASRSLISGLFPVIMIDTTGKSSDEVFSEFKRRVSCFEG